MDQTNCQNVKNCEEKKSDMIIIFDFSITDIKGLQSFLDQWILSRIGTQIEVTIANI